jgi:hypothetical protein
LVVPAVPIVPVYATILTPLKSTEVRTVKLSLIVLKSRASILPVTIKCVILVRSEAVKLLDNFPAVVKFTVLET